MIIRKAYLPEKGLDQLVNKFWALDIPERGDSCRTLHVMSDKFPRVIIQCMNGRSALRGPEGCKAPVAAIFGAAVRAMRYTIAGSYSHIALRLYPDALKVLFDMEATALEVPFTDFNKHCPKNLIPKIMDARDHRHRIAILCDFFRQRSHAGQRKDRLVSDFLRDPSKTRYSELRSAYSISERQFGRRFLSVTGVGPKTFRRMHRFEQALELLRAGRFTYLSDIAYSLKYSDQSHFIREFKEFSGLTPSEFLQNAHAEEDGVGCLLPSGELERITP